MAWDDRSASPLGLSFPQAIESGLGLFLTTTSDSGEFLIEGVECEKSYVLIAGGGGLVSPDPLFGARVNSSEPHILEVVQANAAMIRVVDSDGQYVPVLAKSVVDQQRISAIVTGASASVKIQRPIALMLAAPELVGVDPEYHVISGTTERYGESIERVSVFCEIPGYRKLTGTVFLNPVNASIPRFDLRTEKLIGVATLRVRFALAASGSSSRAFVPDGQLELSAVGSGKVLSTYSIRASLERDRVEIRDVPFGEYDVTFTPIAWRRDHGRQPPRSNPQRVVISTSGGDVEIPTATSGWVAIKLGSDSIEPWLDMDLAIGIIEGVPVIIDGDKVLRDPQFINLNGAKAVIGFPPGKYTMWASWTKKSPSFVTCDVMEQGITEVILH